LLEILQDADDFSSNFISIWLHNRRERLTKLIQAHDGVVAGVKICIARIKIRRENDDIC